MTGSLLWNPCNVEPFTRLEFFFDDGGCLVYTDVRRFGTMYLVKQSEEVTSKLGIEPLGSEFTSLSLANLIHARSAPIKAVLLDQGLIAGIGNMYADEALFASKIHPLRASMDLDKAEIGTLYKSGVCLEKL
jgi:formamidopyrimidine-DNA glycosylase